MIVFDRLQKDAEGEVRMKNNKILSFVLAMTLLMSCVITGFAEETTYTEAQILANAEKGDSLDFTQMTEEEIEAFGTAGTNAITTKDDGLRLIVGDGKKNDGTTNLGYGEIDLDLTHKLKDGEAVKFTFMPTTESNDVLVIADFMGYGERLKVRSEVVGKKQVLVYHTGVNGSSSSRGISSFEISANKTYDVITKKNAGKIDLYAKESTDSEYQLILSEQPIYAVTATAYKLHISGAPGSTAIFKGVTQYVLPASKSEVLDNAGAALHHFDFDETYDGVVNTDATSDEGLDYNKISNWSTSGQYIPDGGAMAVRFKINNSSFQAWVAGEEGRAILLVGTDGNVKLKINSANNTQIDVSSIEQDTWYTFILKDNGTGWDVWMAKDENDGFIKKLSVKEKEEATIATNTNIGLTGTSNTYVDYFTVYGPTAMDVPDEDGMLLLHHADFANDTDILNDEQVLTKTNAAVSNCVLSLDKTTDGENVVSGSYSYDHTGIPAGGYAEFSVTSPGIINKFYQGGHYMAVNIYAYGLDGVTHTFKYPDDNNSWTAASNVTHTPNVRWIYRVARSADGNTYSVWRKSDGTDGWTKVFNKITARSGQTDERYSFDGEGKIDYVKIYTPGGEGIVLTDGKNTTTMIDGTSDFLYKKEIRVIAKPGEEGVINVGLYDVKGVLKNLVSEPISANEQKSVVVDVSNASTLRAFVWDSNEQMRPLCDDYILDCNKNDYFIDFNDGDDLSDWTIGDNFVMHDGRMEYNGVDSSSHLMQKAIDPVDEYVFEMRVQCPEYGYNGLTVQLNTGQYYVAALVNPERNTDVRTATALAQGGELVWDKDEWKILRIETYDGGKRGILSFDGVPYMDFELPKSSYKTNEIIIGGYQKNPGTRATTFSIDWMSFETKEAKDKITVTTPVDGAEYFEGSDIQLTAAVDSDLTIPQIEYKLHGNTVAVGYAPDYKATLENVSAGNYDIVAEYREYQSPTSTFVVNRKVDAELKITGTNSDIAINPNLSDEMNQVARAEYYVDGKLSATTETAPFDVNLSGLLAASHRIHAKFYNENGVIVHRADATYIPAETDSVNFSNDVTYGVTGEGGTAEVKVANGRHSLVIQHSADKVSYLTCDGMKEYPIKSRGNWEIITDAYVADVYRNGQLVFSYIMPKTEEVDKAVTDYGLGITDFKVTIPERKSNFFLQNNYQEQGMQNYELSNLPYDYNLDFIASKEDNLHFAVSDNNFHLDFEFENGKIWAQDVDNEGMHPKRRYQADVPDINGDIYYRAEVAGGFMRLYADGKWLTTVRMPRSSDPDALAIETDSILKYISVCENEDLYLYSDNFDGSGEISALDYWELKETTATVDEVGGYLTLTANEGNEGRAEINATPGYAVVETNLDLSKCEGGAYILFNGASNATEMRAGYNKSTKKFEIIKKTRNGETKLTANAGYDILLALLFGQPLKMRVEMEQQPDGEIVRFYVNESLVLTDTEGLRERGTVGLVFGSGTLKVDYFNYRGDGHPVVSAKEWDTDLNTQYNLIEKEEEWVLLDWSTRLRSNDFGQTWTNESITSRTLESCHTVRLQSGAVLVANRVFGTDKDGFRTTTYRSGISYDDGETWKLLGTIAEPAYGEATCNRLKQGLSGRVYFVMSRRGAHDDGWCRVYWSDDEGETWREGPELGFSNIGHTVCEAEVIEMPDGEVRLYFRNETGMLLYITSDDYGETWNLTPHKTSLLMPGTHYTIEQDPYEPNTFYAVYTYSNSNEHGRDQGPRCRLAVSVSYDGGNQWNYIGTLFEEEVELFYATSGNDVNTMMNVNINVAKDHLVVTLPYNSELPLTNRNFFLRIITLDKAKVKSLAKPEKLHTRAATIEQSAPVIEEKMERTMAVTKESARALIGGKVYCNVAKGEFLPAELVADFLGAIIESKSAQGVTLKQGDYVVSLESDAVNCTDGITYVSLDAISKKFHLHTKREDGLTIVSPYPNWSIEQVRTFQYALNLFADGDRAYVNTNIDPEDTWDAYIKYLND